MQNLTVQLGALDLDLNNPRINPAEHQTEALRLLLRAESVGDRIGEKVYALAKSISELGRTDPSERLIVTANPASPHRYIVLDGNRRVAALKLLTEPALLDRDDIGLQASMRRRIHALRNQYDISDIPTALDIVVFPSREEAEPFVVLKHTGERDGAGRSAWSAMQQARFEATGAYQLLQRLRADQLLNSETLVQLDASDFPISTFERAAASSEFALRFGGRLASDNYDEGQSSALALRAWAQIANDTASGEITSRTIQRSDEVEDYLRRVLDGLTTGAGSEQVDGEAAAAPVDPGASTSSEPALGDPPAPADAPAAPTSEPAPVPRVRAQRIRHYLVDRRRPLPVTHLKCRKIHNELMDKVKVTEAPYGAALLLRTFLELTAQHYLHQFALPLSNNATQNIENLASDLQRSVRASDEPADRGSISLAMRREAGAYESLSSAAHSRYTNLSTEHVRATWDSLEPALRLAWYRISQLAADGGQAEE